MNDELRRRIEKEIDASGFPLELDVARELQRRRWSVTPNLMFDEHESDATHEIDAIAMAPASTPPSWPFGVIGLLLMIECKRSRDKPWVFFTHEWDPFFVMGLAHKAKILSELNLGAAVASFSVRKTRHYPAITWTTHQSRSQGRISKSSKTSDMKATYSRPSRACGTQVRSCVAGSNQEVPLRLAQAAPS